MLPDTPIQAAQALATAWHSRTLIDFPSDLLPRNRTEAYTVQDQMAQLIAADAAHTVVGWKVGATSPGVQKAEGYDGPIPGRIFASTCYHSPADIPAGDCPHANLEAEVAFRFTIALDPRRQPFTIAELIDCVVLHPAFDITSTRFSPTTRVAWNKTQNMLAGIADNGNGGAIVIGSEITQWQELSLMTLRIDLRVNDGEALPNLFNQSRGDPVEALCWTVNSICQRGFTLQAGDIILTGSLTQPHPFSRGDRAHAHFPGIGGLAVRLA